MNNGDLFYSTMCRGVADADIVFVAMEPSPDTIRAQTNQAPSLCSRIGWSFPGIYQTRRGGNTHAEKAYPEFVRIECRRLLSQTRRPVAAGEPDPVGIHRGHSKPASRV